MNNTLGDNKTDLKNIVITILFSVMAVYIPGFSKIWGLSVIIIGSYQIIRHRNRNEEAAKWSAYFAGLEMIMRTTNGNIFYESGKYGVILFLVLGLFYSPPSKKYDIWWGFIILLVPGLLITNHFESARFALSGPLALAIASVYFAGRYVCWHDYKKIIKCLIIPVIGLCVILTLKTPDFSKIVFTANSMYATTGGAGPNQISGVLGGALLLMLVMILINSPLLFNRVISIGISAYIGLRLLLSFSRAGLFACIISFIVVVWQLIKHKYIEIRSSRLIGYVGILLIFSFSLWQVVNTITGGMAYNRFSGRDTAGNIKEDISTGREDLFAQEIQMFLDNPFTGIGAGEVVTVRNEMYSSKQPSHTEYSRLLAEHGFFGVIDLIILLAFPLFWYRKTYGYSRIFFMANMPYALLIFFPSSTRIIFPLFLYGLSFLNIDEEYEDSRELRSAGTV